MAPPIVFEIFYIYRHKFLFSIAKKKKIYNCAKDFRRVIANLAGLIHRRRHFRKRVCRRRYKQKTRGTMENSWKLSAISVSRFSGCKRSQHRTTSLLPPPFLASRRGVELLFPSMDGSGDLIRN